MSALTERLREAGDFFDTLPVAALLREAAAALEAAEKERDEAIYERDLHVSAGIAAIRGLRLAEGFIVDALEDDELLARPEKMWVRLICTRNAARSALAAVGARQEPPPAETSE